jgi:hypothetical protein
MALVAGGLLATMLPGMTAARGGLAEISPTFTIAAPDPSWAGRLASDDTLDHTWDGRPASGLTLDYTWDGRPASGLTLVYTWDGR